MVAAEIRAVVRRRPQARLCADRIVGAVERLAAMDGVARCDVEDRNGVLGVLIVMEPDRSPTPAQRGEARAELLATGWPLGLRWTEAR